MTYLKARDLLMADNPFDKEEGLKGFDIIPVQDSICHYCIHECDCLLADNGIIGCNFLKETASDH